MHEKTLLYITICNSNSNYQRFIIDIHIMYATASIIQQSHLLIVLINVMSFNYILYEIFVAYIARKHCNSVANRHKNI